MSFLERLKDRIHEWRYEKKHFAGQGLIRIPLKDLEDLIRAVDDADRILRSIHNHMTYGKFAICVFGGTEAERRAMVNFLMMQSVLEGYSVAETPPSGLPDGEVFTLRLTGTKEEEYLTPYQKFPTFL